MRKYVILLVLVLFFTTIIGFFACQKMMSEFLLKDYKTTEELLEKYSEKTNEKEARKIDTKLLTKDEQEILQEIIDERDAAYNKKQKKNLYQVIWKIRQFDADVAIRIENDKVYQKYTTQLKGIQLHTQATSDEAKKFNELHKKVESLIKSHGKQSEIEALLKELENEKNVVEKIVIKRLNDAAEAERKATEDAARYDNTAYEEESATDNSSDQGASDSDETISNINPGEDNSSDLETVE